MSGLCSDEIPPPDDYEEGLAELEEDALAESAAGHDAALSAAAPVAALPAGVQLTFAPIYEARARLATATSGFIEAIRELPGEVQKKARSLRDDFLKGIDELLSFSSRPPALQGAGGS